MTRPPSPVVMLTTIDSAFTASSTYLINVSSPGECFHQASEVRFRGKRLYAPDHPRRQIGRHGEACVAAELRLDLVPSHGRVGTASRMVLPLLDDATIPRRTRT